MRISGPLVSSKIATCLSGRNLAASRMRATVLPWGLVVTVGEVQAADVETLVDELHEHVNIPAARAHSANDLAFSVEAIFGVLLQRNHGGPGGWLIQEHRALLVHGWNGADAGLELCNTTNKEFFSKWLEQQRLRTLCKARQCI